MTKLEFTDDDFESLRDYRADIVAIKAQEIANARLKEMLAERGAGIFLRPVAMGSPALIEADGRTDATHTGIVVNVEALDGTD